MINRFYYIFFFLVPVSLYSQLDTNELKDKLGIFQHIGVENHSAEFKKLPNVPSCCPNYYSTSGFAYGFGMSYEYILDYDFQIAGKMAYYTSSSEFSSDEIQQIILDGKSQVGIVTHYANVDLGYLNIGVEGGYNIWKQLKGYGGLQLGILTKYDFNQKSVITKPSDRGTFQDGRKDNNDTSGTIDNISSIQFGFTFGLSYQLQMNSTNNLFLVPEIYYYYNFTPIVSDYDWNTHGLRAGIAIKYRKPPTPSPPPPPPPPPPYPLMAKVKEVPILSAKINVKQVGTNKKDSPNGIKIEDFISTNMRPLLNYIFFSENSSEIEERYIQFDKNEAKYFQLKDLENLDAISTYYQVLNLLGKRLQENQDAKINLIGCNSNENGELNNLELSKQRAESIKEYFHDIWGIDEDRMSITARNLPKLASRSDTITGLQENRRVEIISDNEKITESVLTVDTLRIVTETKFEFQPEVIAEGGLKSWEIRITQNGGTLELFKGNNVIPKKLVWKITNKNDNLPQNNSKIFYNIVAEDSLGQTIRTKRKFIPVEQLTVDRKRLERRKDKEYEYYSLILFPYGSASLGYEHRKVVDFVKNRIAKNAKVNIYGHSDAVGEEMVNKRIATQRAMAVSNRLKIRNANVEGIGESQILYNNELPEGRFYCRTVRISIETPFGTETEEKSE